MIDLEETISMIICFFLALALVFMNVFMGIYICSKGKKQRYAFRVMERVNILGCVNQALKPNVVR